MASKLRLIILGAPGSGKGTISSRIVKEFRLAHISSGDLLRYNIEKKTEIGLKAKDYVSKGQLLPDDFISRLILQEVQRLSNSSWLLDGFPRSLNQCQSLQNKLIYVDRVVNLNVPFQEIINRLKNRWVHPGSGRIYNNEFNPPKVPRKDDVTGEPLIQRPDDQEEVVLKRLKDYEKQSKPVIDFYASKNLVSTYTGNTSDYLWPLIKNDLEKLNNAKQESEAAKFQQDVVTHTGQEFTPDDYRRVRFVGLTGKQVNKNFAIDLVAQDPIVVCNSRVVWSSSGGPLGHPKVYINLDPPEEQVCGYSGRRFIHKKYYDEAKHGKSVSYDQYLKDVARLEREA